MELDFAILADAAEVSSAGKISMLGGGIDRINALSMPAVVPSLSLAYRLRVDLTECDIEHHARLELIDPDGKNILPEGLGTTFVPRWDHDRADLPVKFLFVMNLAGTTFQVPGPYLFRLVIDDAEIGTLPCAVVLPKSPSTT